MPISVAFSEHRTRKHSAHFCAGQRANRATIDDRIVICIVNVDGLVRTTRPEPSSSGSDERFACSAR